MGSYFFHFNRLRSHFDSRRGQNSALTQFCLQRQVTLARMEINMSSNTRVWVIGQSSHVFLSFCSKLATGVCALRMLAHATPNTFSAFRFNLRIELHAQKPLNVGQIVSSLVCYSYTEMRNTVLFSSYFSVPYIY